VRDVLEEWLNGEGQAFLDRITGGSPDVVGVMDRDYVIRYVNFTTPGLSREQVIGTSAFDLIPPADNLQARAAFDQAIHHGKPARFEMFYRGEYGVLVWMVRVGPIVHEGEVIGAFTINTDVTEERRASLDRDRFFALSNDMLAVASPDGHLRRINPAFSAALGYDSAEITSRPFTTFVHPDDVEATRAAFAQLQAGTLVESFENRYRRSDGTYRTFSWRSTHDPLTSDVYAVARDVTDQRTTEAHLRHAQKMEAVGQLAGGIAHDFNNLIQAVLANVEIAQTRYSPPAELDEHLGEIAGAARRAAELTKQLLVFSRLQPLHRVAVDIDELLDGLMRMLQRLLPENITIERRAGTKAPTVHADRTQLEQVVLNLCVNARDAMPEGGKLTIGIEGLELDARYCELHPWAKPGRFARLCVTDTGEGMTPAVRERIFEPFFTTKEAFGGTGLGLATVYGIVRGHGGLLHVDSAVGHGSTFGVYLAAAEATSATSRTVAKTPVPAAGIETLLLVEDDDLVRKPMIKMLKNGGYRVLAASNGREAVATLQENADIALVILDVVMPELGGPEAWEVMRTMRPDLRVIFMSGYVDPRSRAKLPPGEQILDKPFSPAQLLGLVREKLDA
jgi:two-component system cell cycle sensor histidine kinase/response regulator CckA